MTKYGQVNSRSQGCCQTVSGVPSPIRRDQRAICFAARAARRPVPLSTTPAPLLKPRARHELAFAEAASAVCFRRKFGVVASAARLHSFRSAHFAFRFTPSNFRPKLCGKIWFGQRARATQERWQFFDDMGKRGQVKSRTPACWLRKPLILEYRMALPLTALFLRVAGSALVVVRHFCGASCGCSRRGGDLSQ